MYICDSIWVFPEFKVQIIVQVRFDLCSANLSFFLQKKERNEANKDNIWIFAKEERMYVCMHINACMYICIYVYMYVCCMYVCMYVCTYVCMYVCMDV